MTAERPTSVHYIHRVRYSTQERIVGVFVLLAVGLFFALFAINSKTTHLFEDYVQLHLYVMNAEGIGRDTPVRILGIEVGKVERVEIAPDHRIRITVRIYERYTGLLRSDSVASIGKLSLFGRSSIDISAGSPYLPQLEDGTSLMAEEQLSFDQLVAEFQPVVKGIEESVRGFAALMDSIEANKVAGLLENLLYASGDVKQITSHLADGQGALGMALYDEGFQLGLARSLGSLEQALSTTEQRLQQIDPLLQNLEQLTAEVSKTVEQFSQLADETTTLVRSANTSLTSINLEIKHLPELIVRMNMLMEQTDRLMEGVSNSWLFAGGDRTQRPPTIAVQPHD